MSETKFTAREVFLVYGESGEWDDHVRWEVAAFSEEQAAEAWVARCVLAAKMEQICKHERGVGFHIEKLVLDPAADCPLDEGNGSPIVTPEEPA